MREEDEVVVYLVVGGTVESVDGNWDTRRIARTSCIKCWLCVRENTYIKLLTQLDC